jgi:hypothetical protein
VTSPTRNWPASKLLRVLSVLTGVLLVVDRLVLQPLSPQLLLQEVQSNYVDPSQS